MANELTGFSFQPGQDNGMRRMMNQGAQANGNNMASQALRVLSMRLPNVLGGRPLASKGLMAPPMGGNVPATMLNAGGGQQASLSGAVGGAGSTPTFTPGLGTGNGGNIDPENGNNGSGYSYWPTPPGSPSGWTGSGPLTGGITGGGNYGSGGGGFELGGGAPEFPTLGPDIVAGLMRLFGRG